MIKKYAALFKDVPACALITAIISLILYLLLFMGVCYGFTWLPDDGSFNKTFEKYFILAIAIFMILPFTLSNLLIHFIIKSSSDKDESTQTKTVKRRPEIDENGKKGKRKIIRRKCLLLWIKIFMPTTAIFAISTIATGIYTIIEGTLYLGITILVSGIVLLIFKIHTILIVASLRQYLIEQDSNSIISSPRNSNEITQQEEKGEEAEATI